MSYTKYIIQYKLHAVPELNDTKGSSSSSVAGGVVGSCSCCNDNGGVDESWGWSSAFRSKLALSLRRLK